MYILANLLDSIWGAVRHVFLLIDSIGLTFIDDAYSLLIGAISAFDETAISDIARDITHNCYIIIGIFALFRIALLLVNSIINPDKLTEKQNGIGNMLVNIVITVVLLIGIPLVFDLSRELQGEIINKNYIPKLLIGQELVDSDVSKTNPGKYMKEIATRSLIYPDDRVAIKDDSIYVGNNNCDADCQNAIAAWNNDVSFSTLETYIGTFTKVSGDNVYVYKYTPFVTLIVGGIITYVLLSFAIDIALRSVELAVLEILSPLFIVTYIDPKSASNGPFKKWVSTCGKTYVSLFIKIAIVCLMLLFIGNLDRIYKASMDSSGLLQLLILLAILLFAKKAPKWLGDMLGVGDAGLGGLGIGKKLAGAALVGGLATKASEGLKKQRDKVVDHGKKRLGNATNKAFASYAARREANKAARNEWRNNPSNAGKVLHLSDRKRARDAYEAKNGAIKDKAKAARAQVQADFLANNDLRAFASLRDKYAENAQRINPSYKTGREQRLNALNQRVSDLNEAAKIDSSSLAKSRKNAIDMKKAIAIYGEDFVRQHIKPDGSLDKVACPLNEQQINNAYSGVLNHAPNDVREIAIAQLKLKGVEITKANIDAQMNGWNSYEKALYNSSAFENSVLNQSNYISAEQGKAKANQELAELYSQLQAYENNYTGDKTNSTYLSAIQNFENLIDSKKETSKYYEERIKDAKENFVNAFLDEKGKPILKINADGKFDDSVQIPENVIKNNDSVVEINGEYMTKFGKFEKDSNGNFKFKQQDMSQEMELINTEQEGKRNGKIKNSLESAKPVELKQAEKEG